MMMKNQEGEGIWWVSEEEGVIKICSRVFALNVFFMLFLNCVIM